MIGFLDSLVRSIDTYSKLKAIILVQIGGELGTTLEGIFNAKAIQRKWKSDVKLKIKRM